MATARRPKRPTNRFQRAILDFDKEPPEEHIQLLVEAGLMEQEEADRAKLRYCQENGGGDSEVAGHGA